MIYFSKFIFSYLFINNIQCLILNISLIKLSNVFKIRTTNHQGLGALGFFSANDYYTQENGDYYFGKFVNGLINDTPHIILKKKIQNITENLKMVKQKVKVIITIIN